MKRKVKKYVLLLTVLLSLSSVEAQVEFNFTTNTEGWVVGRGTSFTQSAESGTDGVGVFDLGLTNANISYPGEINCDIYKHIRIIFRNATACPNLRIYGAGDRDVWQQSIASSPNSYRTYDYDLTTDATWVGVRKHLGFQFRAGGATPGIAYIDKIIFSDKAIVEEEEEEEENNSTAGIDKPVIYPYLVDPTEYPNYGVKLANHGGVVTWDAMGNKMLIRDSTSDTFGTYTRVQLDLFKEDQNKWFDIFNNDFSSGALKQISVRGIGKMNLTGDHAYTGKVPDAIVTRIRTDFGEKFAGFDNGEADQEYIRVSQNWGYPKPRTKEGHLAEWNNFYHNYEVSGHYQLRAISDYHAWHYTSKYGSAALIGNQGQPRDDVGLAVAGAMTRGAGKQYGTLWAGKYANQYRFPEIGAKREITAAKKAEYQADYDRLHPRYDNTATRENMSDEDLKKYHKARFAIQGDIEGGPSFSVLRNHLFTEWLRNNSSLGSETPFRSEDVGDLKLWEMPVGVFGTSVQGFNQMQEQVGLPGPLYVSSAFMMDYFSGWKPPQTEAFNKEQDPFEVWAQHPYDAGDFFTLSMFNFMYPGFQNQAWTREQRYIHPATPHGETDAILSDVDQSILNQYGMLVVTGKITTDVRTLRPKLEKFLDESRTLVITADNAKRIFSEWGLGGYATVSANTIVFADGSGDITEEHAYELAGIGSLESQADISNYEVVATSNGNPAVVQFNYGSKDGGNKGKVVLLLSPFGINKNKFSKGDYLFPNIDWHRNTDEYQFIEMDNLIGSPHVMLKHVEKVLAKEYDVRKIFDFGASKELTTLVCRKSSKKYIIGLFNGTLGAENYELNYRHGAISSITKIATYDESVVSELGFKPKGFHNTNVGTTTFFSTPGGSKVLAGGDMALYEVVVADESGINVLNKQTIKPRGEKAYLAAEDLLNLKDSIMAKPSFFEYFDGVKIDAKDLLALNDEMLDSISSWTKNQKLKYIVDGSGVTSESELTALLNKMEALGGSEASDLISTTNNSAVLSAAATKGVNLHNGSNSSDFIFVKEGTNPTTALSGKTDNTVVVFDMEYKEWDDIYDDYNLITDPSSNPGGQLKGKNIERYVSTDYSASNENSNYYLTLRGVQDIKKYISTHEEFFNYFGGVCLQAEYLRNFSDVRLQEDVAWLSARNIDVVIDFVNDLDYIHLGFDSGFPDRIANAKSMMDGVFVKMQNLGLTNALYCASYGAKASQVGALQEVAANALDKGIKMHFRPLMNRRYGAKIRIDVLGRVVDPSDNIYMAPSFVRTNTQKITNEHIQADYTEFVILAAAGDGTGMVSVPISNVTNEFTTDTEVNFDVSNPVFNGKKLIFDAEYLNWDEILTDLDYMEIESVNLLSNDKYIPDSKKLLIYPNPVSDVLTVKLNNENIFVQVYAISGGLVYTSSLKTEVKINCSGFSEGVYIVVTKDSKGTVISRSKIIVD